MMDVTIPAIHRMGINNPAVAIIVKIVCFMMTPSFPAWAPGFAMAHRRLPSRPCAPAHHTPRPLPFISINHAKTEKPA